MVDPADKERLDKLARRIDALKRDTTPAPQTQRTAASGAELAWRMVIELVAGIGIGFAIGYGLDHLFGTLPILMVLFTLFGFAAGVQTMLRTARAAQDPGPAPGEDETGHAPDRDGD